MGQINEKLFYNNLHYKIALQLVFEQTIFMMDHHDGFHIIMQISHAICLGVKIEKKTVVEKWACPSSTESAS